MDNETVFWSGLGSLLFALIIALTVSNINTNKHIAEAVAKGVDPIAAMCTFNYSESKAVICNRYVDGKKTTQ